MFYGNFWGFSSSFMYVTQHCFIYRPSDSTVSEDAGIELRTVATLALTARRSNHSARSHLWMCFSFESKGSLRAIVALQSTT